MRKSIRLLSIFAMALMMTLSFVFAGTLFAKADASVDFGAVKGASVFLPGGEDIVGLNFTVKVNKEDYATLTQLPENASKNVKFGAAIGVNYGADSLAIGAEGVDTFIMDEAFGEYDAENYFYNVGFTMDLQAEYAKASEGQTDFMAYEQFAFMSLVQPYAIKPFYAIYEGDFDATTASIVYAEKSDVRSMLSVAAAVDYAGDSVPATFIAKYDMNVVETDKEVVYYNGEFSGDELITAETEMFVIGDNGEIFARKSENAFSAMSGYTIEEIAKGGETVITAMKQTSSNPFTVVIERAKLTVIDAIVPSAIADGNGKIFLNNTIASGVEISSVIVDGVEVANDEGNVDLALANKKVGDTFSALISDGEANYLVEDIEIYTKVFENTAESRIDMVNTFHTPSAKTVDDERITITGSYALAENIYFNHYKLDENGNKTYDDEGQVIYSNAEMFANHYTDLKVDTDGDGELEKVYVNTNTFAGIFDGRGYALNDVLMKDMSYNSMFGTAGDGAVLKNFAINNVYSYVNNKTVDDGSGTYGAVLFRGIESAEAAVTFENLYVYRYVSSSSRYYGIITYSSDENNSFGKSTFNNVVMRTLVDSEEYVNDSSKYTQIFGSISKKGNMTLTDSYFISNSRICSNSTTVSGITKFSTIADFKAADNDYSSFNTNYWTITTDENGTMPIWNSINVIPELYNEAGEEIYAINSEVLNEKFTFVANDENGEAQAIAITSTLGEAIVINGNEVTIVGEGVFAGTITATVGNVSVVFNVNIDNRPLINDDTALVLSKADGKLYYEATGEEVELNNLSYEGIELIKDGKIDLSLIVDENGEVVDLGDAGKVITLYASTADAKCNLTNVKVYAAAFVNTHESRMLMRDMFSHYAVRAHTNGADSKVETNDGYYVLLSNITFDYSNLPMTVEDALANDNPENLKQSEWYKKAPYEYFVNSGADSKYASIFAGTFDGRGYTINGAGVFGSFFGVAADGAVVKNVAFNEFKHFSSAPADEDNLKRVFTEAAGNGAEGKIFSTVLTADASVTFENVYIKDSALDDKTYGSLLFYSSFKNEDGSYAHGNLTFKNVIIENTRGPVVNGITNGFPAFNDTDSVTDTYVITTSSIARGYPTVGDNTRGENFVKYASLEEMKKDDKNSYATFSSAYWTIKEGVPVWNNLPVAFVTDAEGRTVAGITELGSYKANVSIAGKAVETGITTSSESEYISCDGANIVVDGSGRRYTATISIFYNGALLDTIAVAIDDRVATAINEEILLSKSSGKLFFNETSFAGNEPVLESATYNGAPVFVDGAIDASTINVNAGTAITLDVSTADELYTFTNVKVYDGVYAQENKKEFVDLLKYDGELTGYYVLAGNIDFTGCEASEYLSKKEEGDVYKATIDGRGYTITNITIPTGTNASGFFGYVADGGVIKNIALYGITVAGSNYAGYLGFFLGGKNGTGVLTFDNVYVYRRVDSYGTGANSSNLLCYNTAENVFNLNNFIFELEFAPEVDSKTANVAPGKVAGTATNSYLLANSRASWGPYGASEQKAPEGTIYYGTYQQATIADARLAMAEANNDYSSFSSAYWTIVNGIPVWNNCPIATVVNAENVPVATITESGSYKANVSIGGKAVESGITTSSESEYISCDGANIVVDGTNVKFTATIEVYYNAKVLAVISVAVDNRVATAINEEVLLSKADGKLYLNGTSATNLVLDSVAYNGTAVLADGVIDTTLIDVAVNTAFTLDATAEDDLYTFTNVKMYDGVYAQDNRAEFVKLLGKYEETLTGYYVLAENITFDITNSKERFSAPDARVFNATFDGRGYTLNNVNLSSSTFCGMFGTLPGTNAVLKNFAINNIFTNGATTAGGAGQSLLFGGKGAVLGENILTMENVYIYRYLSTASRYSYIFYYTDAGSNITFNLNNVFIEYDQDMVNTNNLAGKAAGIIKTAAENGTVTNTYFSNGCGATNYKVALPGVVSINTYDDIATRRALLATGANFSSFPSTFWEVAEGKMPAWKTSSAVVATAEELASAIAKGGEITLISDITISNTLSITADTTIYGAGKTLTYTGSNRAIDVASGVDADLTINDLDIVVNKAERGVNYNTNGTLILNTVKISGTVTYAVNLPSSSSDATVVINNSEINGVIALNVWGANVNATIENSALTSVYGVAGGDAGTAIYVNNDGTTHAENCTITITGGSIAGTLADGTANTAIYNLANGTKFEISEETTIVGEIVNENCVAIVEHAPYGYFYAYTSLEEAVAASIGNANTTVKLAANVSLEALEVLGNVTIDLNGYELTITAVNGEGLTVIGTGSYNGVAQ